MTTPRRTYRNYKRKRSASIPLTPTQRAQVKRLLHSELELKYNILFEQELAVSNTVDIADFTNMAQGDGFNQRTGAQVHIKKIDIRGHIVAGDDTNVVRMIIFRWKPNSVPVAADIFDEFIIGTNGGIFAGVEPNNKQNIVVLYDKFFNMGKGDNNSSRFFKLSIGAQPTTMFDTGASTLGANHIYCMLYSDSGAVPHPAITYRGEMHYTDA